MVELIQMSSQLVFHSEDVKTIELSGDIIIGGLFPIHQRSKQTENACGVIDRQPGFQYLAAMLFFLFLFFFTFLFTLQR